MYFKKNAARIVSFLATILFIGIFVWPVITNQTARAQYWSALPPYNTLWPLWSPALSPVDDTTGLPTPLVTSLTPGTVLPLQPGLTWHPGLRNPWLLYNTPLGLVYYDLYNGIDLWPPDFLINQITGLPINLTLPADYAFLPPTSNFWIVSNLPAANWDYLAAYPTFSAGTSTPALTSLLTGPNLLGIGLF